MEYLSHHCQCEGCREGQGKWAGLGVGRCEGAERGAGLGKGCQPLHLKAQRPVAGLTWIQ